MNVNRITTLLMLSSASFFSQASSYEVQELPTSDLSFNQFASSIDNTGLMLTLLNRPFNPPVDLSLIDFDTFTLTDPEAAAQGNFNAVDLATIMNRIISQTTNSDPVGQKIAAFVAYQTDGTDFNYVYGFDNQTDATNGYTYSLGTTLGDSALGSHIVGTMAGPYSQVEYTDADGNETLFNVNSFNYRGFVQVGEQVTELLPPKIDAGGISRAIAINNNLMVAGVASVAFTSSIQGLVDDCLDDEQRGDIPVEICLYTVINLKNSFSGESTFDSNITTRATTWQLDNAGNVIDRVVYDLDFEPDAEEARVLSSQARDINNNNVAIGTSIVSVNGNLSQAASLFQDGVVTRLITDDDLLPNVGLAINDNGYVVGVRQQFIDTATRTKMFVYDMRTEELLFPTDFFASSSSTPRAMNNNNLVVGDAEAIVTSTSRIRNGFLYDIEADSFTNLNTLLPCDSPYTIVAGNDINDSDEIIADAVIRRPRRNFKGEVLTDADGNEQIIDTVVAVKLVPTGNEPAECEKTEDEKSATERKGASVGYFVILGLCGITFLRRLRKLKN